MVYLQQERTLTPPAKKLKISTEAVPATEKSPDTIAQELLVRIEKHLDRIEKRQDVIMSLLVTRISFSLTPRTVVKTHRRMSLRRL